MPRWWNTRRFDALELLLVALLAAVSGVTFERRRSEHVAWVARSAAQESEWLRNRFGPSRYSRHEEEWVIRDYFEDRHGGFFVDVGANHYRDDSNTYYLEKALEWSGLAIDPQAEFAAGYQAHRPRTRFLPYFVSDEPGANVTLYRVDENRLVASADRDFAERAGTDVRSPVYNSVPVSVPTATLTDLLNHEEVRRVDLLSIDVELAEPKVLAGFDIRRFRPALVCIEAHPTVRQQILDYFAANGYVLLGRYLRADLQNLYFRPAGTEAPSAVPVRETDRPSGQTR